jgi:hypothetical protein
MHSSKISSKHLQILALISLTFASCASSKQPASKIPEPQIGIEQVVGPAELGYPYGPIEIKYNLAVQNNAAEPITLIRVDLQSSNPIGGAYSLRRDFHNVHQTIPPNSIGIVSFWARAFSWGRGPRETEPVSVRGVAYFESPSGTTQKVFIRELSQYAQ